MAGLCCDSDLFYRKKREKNKSGIKNSVKPLKSNNIILFFAARPQQKDQRARQRKKAKEIADGETAGLVEWNFPHVNNIFFAPTQIPLKNEQRNYFLILQLFVSMRIAQKMSRQRQQQKVCNSRAILKAK